MLKDKKIIIQILATKYNLSLKKVENIVNSQFKFVEKIMKQGNFDSVRLPYFGKFSVNPNRIKHITKLNEKRKKEK
jgi:nucleoid DNA-binding protein|tara:strand:- start:6098 stop:6325 length:228 start_codon:yes stop_codon:yes gene_type:complete